MQFLQWELSSMSCRIYQNSLPMVLMRAFSSVWWTNAEVLSLAMSKICVCFYFPKLIFKKNCTSLLFQKYFLCQLWLKLFAASKWFVRYLTANHMVKEPLSWCLGNPVLRWYSTNILNQLIKGPSNTLSSTQNISIWFRSSKNEKNLCGTSCRIRCFLSRYSSIFLENSSKLQFVCSFVFFFKAGSYHLHLMCPRLCFEKGENPLPLHSLKDTCNIVVIHHLLSWIVSFPIWRVLT